LTGGSGDTGMVNGTPKHVIGYMKDFLFSSEQARTPLGKLSGGERGRHVRRLPTAWLVGRVLGSGLQPDPIRLEAIRDSGHTMSASWAATPPPVTAGSGAEV